jgi:Leucine-rich repeat (LRR) protein
MPNLLDYKNIIYLNISSNKIRGIIDSSNINSSLIELVCDNNYIKYIESSSIERLVAYNNIIENIFIPNIRLLIINNNKLLKIDSYNKLSYLECIDNQIEIIDNMDNIEELYISNNNIKTIGKIMPKLTILNCAKNPINKIDFYCKLNFLVCSTSYISSKYKIQHMSKVKEDYFISIKK